MSRRFLHSSAGFLFIRPIRIRPRSIPVRRLLSLQSTSDPRRPLKDRQQESARRNKAVCCGAEQSLLSKYFQFTSNIHTMSSQPVPEAAAAAPEVSQSRASGAEASCAAASEKTAVAPSAPEPEPKLPPLSAAEYREYNRLADSMEYFHNHFKQTWNMMYTAAGNNRRPANMTLRQFIDTGLAFVRQLTMHHNIEEQLLYPQLAVRMDDFRNQDGKKGGSKPSRKQSELLLQHRLIHEGMDRFEDYLTECRRGQLDFEMATLKTKMDDWNDVLWLHLDAEVETLKAENMRKYWTLPEMRRLQI
ncbi:hypothetical protein MCOR27_008044 [Pyricularia oryzae]|uniref:Hemerythrin-like domain-containing protein n=5 Tax=Pyricularia TaxID=48558 RepID=A0ABQ8N398_PYRGI|nr:uncharacterized protein MGG_05279 [Pyricularia oryzae 70-15]KAH8848219.1 hypothetical protein MCOR01_001604 [Pyricularia oryzae]KAI6290547.1 hypothetical protein MCOR33_011234 [Pyricularia grisea]EHA53031.1 hypothetical protein MGG_05279 [Pyricularia oryzae 70-15]KAI6254007.1 hypothetical protein MCOR19_009477 [Pyricularia oryzae]KAI6264329.1 hypothetical protein MCOR26_011417 [Pyricularia oryzae]